LEETRYLNVIIPNQPVTFYLQDVMYKIHQLERTEYVRIINNILDWA